MSLPKKKQKKSVFRESIHNFIRTLRITKDQNIALVFPVLLDFISIFLIGFISNIFYYRVEEQVSIINLEISKNSEKILGSFLSDPRIYSIISAYPAVKEAFIEIIMLTLLLGILIFMIYSALQGLSWKVSYRYAYRLAAMKRFIPRFALVSAMWGAIIILLKFFELVFSLREIALLKLGQVSGYYAPQLMISLLFMILIYFMIISYCLLDKRSAWKAFGASFKIGIRGALKLFPPYVLIILLLLAINAIIINIPPYGIRLLLEVMLLIPLLTVIRVFFLLELKSQGHDIGMLLRLMKKKRVKKR